jgi:hypothetical protein
MDADKCDNYNGDEDAFGWFDMEDTCKDKEKTTIRAKQKNGADMYVGGRERRRSRRGRWRRRRRGRRRRRRRRIRRRR